MYNLYITSMDRCATRTKSNGGIGRHYEYERAHFGPNSVMRDSKITGILLGWSVQ